MLYCTMLYYAILNCAIRFYTTMATSQQNDGCLVVPWVAVAERAGVDRIEQRKQTRRLPELGLRVKRLGRAS